MPFLVKNESGWNWNPNIWLELSSRAIATFVLWHLIVILIDEEIKGEPAKYQDNGKIKPDSKMGYISNVKDARKKLESDFKLRPDHKQS